MVGRGGRDDAEVLPCHVSSTGSWPIVFLRCPDVFLGWLLRALVAAILVNFASINCHGVVVQITVRQLECLRLTQFPLGYHFGECGS
jgi:hypothetical protein